MGIIFLPKQVYECSKCGSRNCEEYVESATEIYKRGHYEGVVCNDCRHKTRHYVKSILEEEMGSGYSYTFSPHKPRKF